MALVATAFPFPAVTNLQLPTRILVRPRISTSPGIDILFAVLLVAAFSLIQVLVGGTRLLFSLPAYGLLGVLGLLCVISLRRSTPEPSQLCLISSAIFFGYMLTRAVLSPVPYLARADIYSILGGLLVYLLVACIFTDGKRRMLVLFCLLALATAHVAIGALQFRDGNNFMPFSFLQRYDYGRRASGFYVCPNHLAGLLEVLGIFGLSIACWGRSPVWVKLLAVYGSGVCYLGVLLSASRGGFLSCAASLIAFLLLSLWALRRTGKQLFVKIGGAAAAAAVLIVIIGDVYSNKLLYLNDRVWSSNQEANDNRIDLWKAAVEQFKLEPLIGTGSGTYLFYGRHFRSERIGNDPVEVHNDYLHLLAEYGLAGALGFLLFFGAHLVNGWKNFQRLGPKRLAVSTRLLSNSLALQIGALSAVAAYVVHSAIDFNLHIPANVLLLAFVFGLLANPGTQRAIEPSPPTATLVGWRALLPVMGAIVLIQCVRLLPGEYFAEQARVALRRNHAGHAIHYVESALESEKKNPNLYDYLGRAQIMRGEARSNREQRDWFYRRAIEAFKNGRQLAPLDETFALQLGYVYDKLGRFKEGEWMYGEAVAFDPNSKSVKAYYQTHLENWSKAGVAKGEDVGVSPQ